MKKKHVSIPIFIPHLGCPHQCIFCNQKHTSSTYSQPDRDFVIKKTTTYLEHTNLLPKEIEIAFFGGTFTAININKQIELLEAANIFISSNKINGIRLSTRPDYINEEILDRLKKYNVTTIELGIQSFSDDVLIASKRGHTSKDSKKAIKLIKQYNFDLIIQLMPGLPKSSKERDLESAKISADFAPDGIRIYPTIVMANTELATLYKKKEFTPLSMEEAIEISKKIYLIFKEKNIPVIRLGLHPFSPEELKNILSGPYDPSFGFLIKSRIKRDLMESYLCLISKNFREKKIKLEIPFIEKEEFIGKRKENIFYLEKKFNIKKIDYFLGEKLKIKER